MVTNDQKSVEQEILAGLNTTAARDATYVDLSALTSQEHIYQEIQPVENDNQEEKDVANAEVNTVSPDLDNTSFKANNISNKFKELSLIYGNNIFELSVENTHLYGVLKEIPKLSLSSEWEQNAPASIIDSLRKTITTSTTLQTVNSIFGVKQIPWVSVGNTTTQSYTGCSESTFNLQFRVYSMEAIGPSNIMSGYKRILAALCIYSPPLHTFDADSVLSISLVNLGRTAAALLNSLDGAIDFVDQHAFDVEVPGGTTHEGKKVQKLLSDGYNTVVNAGSAAIDAIAADTKAERIKQLSKFGTALEKAGDALQSFFNDSRIVKDDKQRVEDETNYYNGIYGGALWHLSILPGILNHKLPVYVKSWTAHPSKEIDSQGKAAYMDFTIQCSLDQIKTGTWWNNIIYAAEGDAYKNAYKRNVKTPN